MSVNRSIVGAAAVVLIATLPTAAKAQTRARTECRDGTTSASTVSSVCNGHGGVDAGKTAVLRRSPGSDARSTTVPSRVTQAGSPSSAPMPRTEKPDYEERRGWRWHRNHDDEPRHDEKHERHYRCRDGKWETVHGKAKGREICKKHGGVVRDER